jgi:hypothetical protein
MKLPGIKSSRSHGRAYASAQTKVHLRGQTRVRADRQHSHHGCQGIWRDYIRGPQTFHSHFLHRLGLEKLQCVWCTSWFGHVPLALFCKHAAIHAKGLSLLSPCTTRFATNFLMVARVLDVKEALKQIVTNIKWNTYIRTLSNTQRKPVQTQARELRRLILGDDSEFWQSCANYCTIMKAAMAG